jgi:hypothetical protein
MDQSDTASGDDESFVSIWVGSFGSRTAVDAYTQEQYADDREDGPISPFGGDIGLTSYDHDSAEVNFEPALSDKGETAFSGHSYGDQFGSSAWAEAEKRQVGPFDTTLVLYGYNHSRHPQADRQPQQVRFVGAFRYRVVQSDWFKKFLAENP